MQNSLAWSLCLSAIVVLISILPLSYGRIKAGYSLENMSAPRSLFNDLPEFGKRSVWCHQNCWESISLHAPACLLCLIAMPDSTMVSLAAWSHPFFRFLYIWSYVFDLPKFRGLFWALGLISTIILFKEGLTNLSI